MGITVRKKGSKAVILKFCWILDSTNELRETVSIRKDTHSISVISLCQYYVHL